MNESEAIHAANEFLLKERAVNAHPVQVKYVQRPNVPSFWVVRYGIAILYPKEAAAGAVVEDGDYILKVDDASGVVTRLL